MAWGWAAAGQLGLGQCHQGSHTVLHPTPVSLSLFSSSSSPRLQCTSCVLFGELGLHICPLSQAIVPLASGHRPQTPHYPWANVGEFVALTQYHLLAWTFLHVSVCICTTFAPQTCIKSYIWSHLLFGSLSTFTSNMWLCLDYFSDLLGRCVQWRYSS